MTERFLHRMVGGQLVEKSPMESLTDRELEVFELIGRGLVAKEIAVRLDVSVKTVEAHRDPRQRRTRGAASVGQASLRQSGRTRPRFSTTLLDYDSE
jgi:DNA-binding CsgD family transcriptional regulator